MNTLKLGKLLAISLLIISKTNCMNRQNSTNDREIRRYTPTQLRRIRNLYPTIRPLNMQHIPGITRSSLDADGDNMPERTE